MKYLVLSLASALLIACQPKKAEDPAPAPTEIGDTVVQTPSSGPENSLSYIGLYKGKIPCEGCTNEEVTLELSEDFSYVMTREGVDKGTEKQETKGPFRWARNGTEIVLDKMPGKFTRFSVRDNSLVAVDSAGEKIKGGMLVKVPEGQAAVADGSDPGASVKLTGVQWKLTEINGKAVTPKGDKPYFLEFKVGDRFGAFAGCNRMGGKYEVRGSKIRLHQIISTMMACPELKLEDEFKKALESADNIVANQQVLQLRKGGQNLVKFESVALPKD